MANNAVIINIGNLTYMVDSLYIDQLMTVTILIENQIISHR